MILQVLFVLFCVCQRLVESDRRVGTGKQYVEVRMFVPYIELHVGLYYTCVVGG